MSSAVEQSKGGSPASWVADWEADRNPSNLWLNPHSAVDSEVEEVSEVAAVVSSVEVHSAAEVHPSEEGLVAVGTEISVEVVEEASEEDVVDLVVTEEASAVAGVDLVADPVD